MALRGAALRLVSERGYDATSTDDIAREAGVSPRTFFNYFPTKESVLLLPDDFLADAVRDLMAARPVGEDPTVSIAAVTRQVVETVVELAGTSVVSDADTLAETVRLVFAEPALRQIFLERRAAIEDVGWAALRARGVAADDIAARAAVSSVVSLVYLGLRIWAEGGGTEPLPDVVTRCLAAAPDPARLAAGPTAGEG